MNQLYFLGKNIGEKKETPLCRASYLPKKNMRTRTQHVNYDDLGTPTMAVMEAPVEAIYGPLSGVAYNKDIHSIRREHCMNNRCIPCGERVTWEW